MPIIVAGVSGGKDSAALSLWLTEQGLEHRRVFLDTGWEHRSTLDYLRGELTRVLGPIEEVRGPETMPELIRRKGMFPSRLKRFCTEELKVKPLARYLRQLQDVGAETVNAIGIRAEESANRAAMVEREWNETYDCEIWRPLLRWKLADVIAIHTRHGLRPNPLYLAGAERVGCFPCINARKAEVRLVAKLAPERIQEIAELEAELSARAGAERRYFQARIGRKGVWPIGTVVEWSGTDDGGRQFPLLRDEPDGCARWGLCETGGASNVG